jgi:KipI family sensor histidine kinase inhibitor
MFPIYKPAGDKAILVILGDQIDLQVNRHVHALDRLFSQDSFDGLIETVPTYTSLLVYYDPLLVDYDQALFWIKERVNKLQRVDEQPTRLVELPTHYGGEYGPDLEFVANHQHLSIDEVVQIHTGRDYPVYMMGFTPGFPYLGGMDDRIATPRLQSPRTLVKAGSVGIAGSQTGVYSIDSPGGWQLIGWTAVKLFDPAGEHPILLSPGDMVRFIRVE